MVQRPPLAAVGVNAIDCADIRAVSGCRASSDRYYRDTIIADITGKSRSAKQSEDRQREQQPCSGHGRRRTTNEHELKFCGTDAPSTTRGSLPHNVWSGFATATDCDLHLEYQKTTAVTVTVANWRGLSCRQLTRTDVTASGGSYIRDRETYSVIED
ncbi:uncharacterized protein LOC126780696 [Nymphalis io]|uniref:uncharacterized protein LOC126780696 n=1 Tax=Inachis io TaxID=171585 RepID=UPI0021681BB1|nr:uncharacterized protein LOC126780696 [Nymphalis io]